jgi:Cu/Ag efflux protein CusF
MKGVLMDRKTIVVAILTAAVGVSTGVVGQGMKDMPMGSSAQGATHSGTGTVKKMDAGRGMVTLDHGPIASMKWPSMTMEFEVADKKMLENLKPGSKIQFQFTEKSKGKYMITDVKG